MSSSGESREDIMTLDLVGSCPRGPDDAERTAELSQAVARYRGRHMDVGWPPGAAIEIGSVSEADQNIVKAQLRGFPCVSGIFGMVVLGEVSFDGCRGIDASDLQLIVVCSGGGRVYVLSVGSGILYVVSQGGLEDLLTAWRGLRNVFEIYDTPYLCPSYEHLCFEYNCTPGLVPLVSGEGDPPAVTEFLSSSSGVCCRSVDSTEDLIVFGNRNLEEIRVALPDELLCELEGHGYRAIGVGYKQSLLFLDEDGGVFVLLRHHRLIKVANGVRGLVRDRLQAAFDPQKVVFRSVDSEYRLCVGDVVEIPCDVDYAVRDDWFYTQHRTVKTLLSRRSEPCEKGFLALES